jgi:hypothetical protein
MSYLIEKKKRNSKHKRNLKAAKRAGAVSFDQSFKLNRQPEDALQARADRKSRSDRNARPGRKPVSTVDRIKAQTKFNSGAGRRLHMTTPKAREMEKKIRKESIFRDGSVFAHELLALEAETSELEKRCIADVMGKAAKDPSGDPVKGSRDRLSRAYAICRASLQKSGRIKKGTAEMTKKGRGISGAKAKSKDHDTKVSKFEKAVVAARKK